MIETTISEDLVNSITNKVNLGINIKSSNPLQASLEQGIHSDLNLKIERIVGDTIGNWSKKNKRLNISSWEPNKRYYPQFMLLGTDKGILAYIEFFYHSGLCNINKDYVISYPLEELRERVARVDSDLNRPVFYVHIMDFNDYKDIIFETTEMIKDKILSDSAIIKVANEKDYYFSELCEAGSFNEFISMLEDLKKNNVKFY